MRTRKIYQVGQQVHTLTPIEHINHENEKNLSSWSVSVHTRLAVGFRRLQARSIVFRKGGAVDITQIIFKSQTKKSK